MTLVAALLFATHLQAASHDTDYDDDVADSYEAEPRPSPAEQPVPPKPPGPTKKKRNVVDEESDETRDSSLDLRKGKSYIATVELLGIGTGLLSSSSGVNFGAYRDSDSLIEFSAVVSTNSGSSFSTNKSTDSDTKMDNQTAEDGRAFDIAIRYKQFFGNSFYGYIGPAYRQTEATLKLRSTSSAGVTSSSVDIASAAMRDLGLDGAIGNAWQWSNFTMGCDWIGLHVPIARFRNDYDDKGYITSVKQVNDARRSFVNQARGPAFMMLRFYVGASF